MVTPEATVAAIRDLHRPTDKMYPTCRGCDSEGWESETPDWPCRTARLVYTEAEIGAVDRAAAEHREARRAEREWKQAITDQTGHPDLIPALWGPRIQEQLQNSAFLDRINKRVNER